MGKTVRKRGPNRPRSFVHEIWLHGTLYRIRQKKVGGYWRGNGGEAEHKRSGDWVPRQVSWVVTGPDGFSDYALRKRAVLKHAKRHALRALRGE